MRKMLLVVLLLLAVGLMATSAVTAANPGNGSDNSQGCEHANANAKAHANSNSVVHEVVLGNSTSCP